MKLLWLCLSLICAFVAFLTYPKKAPSPPQVVQQPQPPIQVNKPIIQSPPKAEPLSEPETQRLRELVKQDFDAQGSPDTSKALSYADKEELQYLKHKERKYQRATNPYFHKEVQDDPQMKEK